MLLTYICYRPHRNLAAAGGKRMIGMSLLSFLVLLAIAVVVAALFHFVLRYRFLEGIDSFLGKTAAGWLGGWLGSPVLGHWGFKVDSVYLIPAIVGAVAAVFLTVLSGKALAKACSGRPAA
jgi:uncharacterized membrane protein YeaQ/YmgE (transglycosylase-associated protein family)